MGAQSCGQSARSGLHLPCKSAPGYSEREEIVRHSILSACKRRHNAWWTWVSFVFDVSLYPVLAGDYALQGGLLDCPAPEFYANATCPAKYEAQRPTVSPAVATYIATCMLAEQDTQYCSMWL